MGNTRARDKTREPEGQDTLPPTFARVNSFSNAVLNRCAKANRAPLTPFSFPEPSDLRARYPVQLCRFELLAPR